MNIENTDFANKMANIGIRLDDAIDSVGYGIKDTIVIGGQAIDESLDFIGDKLKVVPVVGNVLDVILDVTGNIIAIALHGGGELIGEKIDHFGDIMEEFLTDIPSDLYLLETLV